MKQEDLNLVERCKRGDQSACAQLVRKYQNSVYSLCRKMVKNPEEARDLAQEAFARTFSTLDRYNAVYAFSGWLYKITANLCIDHLRRQRMKTLSLDEPMEGQDGTLPRELQDRGSRPDEDSERSEMRGAIQTAIARLPEHYRVILLLRHQDQLSYEEIAATLAIPLGTVKARIHRAREGLREYLQAYAA